jgi:alpha-N-arabinofuranosidase
LRGVQASSVRASIITAEKMNAYNDFSKPAEVTIAPFDDVQLENQTLRLQLPSKCVVTVEVQQK